MRFQSQLMSNINVFQIFTLYRYTNIILTLVHVYILFIFLGLCPQTHEDMSDRWLISVFFLFVWECRHHKDSNTVNKMTCCK